MSNRIKVKRGTDANRLNAPLQDNEISYSTDNVSGDGRPRRFWVTDSTATATEHNGNDVLIGPFEFEAGSSGKIAVVADYSTGKVVIDYVDPSTFNPTLTFNAFANAGDTNFGGTSYGTNANPIVEVLDEFDGTHVATVTKASGTSEVEIDYAYVNVGSGNTLPFGGNLASLNNETAASGSLNINTDYAISGSNFNATNLGSRQIAAVVSAQAAASSGVTTVRDFTRQLRFGWRIRGFYSAAQYNEFDVSTTLRQAIVGGGSVFNTVVQSPKGTPNSNTLYSYQLPASGGPYFLYFVHSCMPGLDGNNNEIDTFGWTPTFRLQGSGGAENWFEVTNLDEAVVLQCSGGGALFIGGQTNTVKQYRVWRSPSAFAPSATAIQYEVW